jgi:hypothetical protein
MADRTLAVEGRRELVLAHVTGLQISWGDGYGNNHRIDLEFQIGGRVLRGRDWVSGPSFPRPGEEANYIEDQMRKPYRLYVTYVPSNPAIYSFDPVNRATVMRAGTSWGLALLFLASGLGLLCTYSRPS